MSEINSKRLLQKDFWSYKVKLDEGIANGISKFRSLLDRMAGVGVRDSEGDKRNALLSGQPHSWQSFTNQE
jgi:hypothetical protein